jgi:hypothetical protein
MTGSFSQIKWVRVIVTALIVYILSFLLVFVIVTGYASVLAFQARGAPDQAAITAFADQYAPWIGPISLIVFTVLGAMHAARRVDAPSINGIALGVLAAIMNFVLEGARALDFGVLLTTVLTVLGGWLGANFGSRRS